MSGFWSAGGDGNKSIRELAYGHASHYEPPIDQEVNSYRDFYGHFHSPEPQYINPNDYSHMYHPPQGGNEHLYSAQLSQSSLLDQLEAGTAALEMQMHESVAYNSFRQSEIYACTLCGGLGHPAENCYILHEFRQSREHHKNPKYEMPTDYIDDNHWDHNQPFQGCDQSFIYPNDHAHMYHPPYNIYSELPTVEDSPFIEQHNEILELNQNLEQCQKSTDQRFASLELKLSQICDALNEEREEFQGKMYVSPNEKEISTVDDSHSLEQLNTILRMNLIHLQNQEKEGFQNEMFITHNEVNYDNSMPSLTRATDIAYEPVLNEGTKNTTILNGEMHFYDDEDDCDYDVMLEEHAFTENIVEPLGSETLGSSASTLMNDVSSSVTYTCDVDTNLEHVRLFCEDEHAIQLDIDLENVESSVDTNDTMHENKFDVSDSLPKSQCEVSCDIPMHETEVVGDNCELGLIDLFYEHEHDIVLVSDLGRVESYSNTDKNNLESYDSMLKSQHDCLNGSREVVKPILWTTPSFGLELRASQVLLDYFAAKYNTLDEPQLEFTHVSPSIPDKIHLELDLVHDAPLKLLDFVPKSLSIEKYRFGGNSFTYAVLPALLSCYNCVRLLLFSHSVCWVDPQLFRLLVYGEYFCI